MLEGTTAKTRDGGTRGTPTVRQQTRPVPTSTDADETGVTQVLEAAQRETVAPAVQTAMVACDPRLVRTRAAAGFSYMA